MVAFTERGAPYPFELTRDAEKQLRAMSDRDARRIAQAIVKTCEAGAGDVLPLKGETDQYRLRVGEYRIIFRVAERRHAEKRREGLKTAAAAVTRLVVQVLSILRRSDTTYKKR